MNYGVPSMRRAFVTLLGALAACASLEAPQPDAGGAGGGQANAGGAGGGSAGGMASAAGAGGSGGGAAATMYPTWQLEDIQPQSPRFMQTYGLGVFLGRPLVAILWEGF